MKTFHNLLFFCASVIAAGFMSCSKDDSSGSGLAQTSVVKDSVRVDFSLTNSRGDTTATFSYGEDIVFDLKVQGRPATGCPMVTTMCSSKAARTICSVSAPRKARTSARLSACLR